MIIRWHNLQEIPILVHSSLSKDSQWECESEEFHRKTSINAFIWQANYTKKESALFLSIMMNECSWESFCIRLSCISVVPLVLPKLIIFCKQYFFLLLLCANFNLFDGCLCDSLCHICNAFTYVCSYLVSVYLTPFFRGLWPGTVTWL